MDTTRLKTRLIEMATEARSAVEEEEMEPGGWDRGWTLGYANGLDAALERIEELEDLPPVTEEQRASFERGRDEITGCPAYSGGPNANLVADPYWDSANPAHVTDPAAPWNQ